MIDRRHIINKLINVGILLVNDNRDVDEEMLCDVVWLAAVGLQSAAHDRPAPPSPEPPQAPDAVGLQLDADDRPASLPSEPLQAPDAASVEPPSARPASTDPSDAVGLYSPAADHSGWGAGQRVKLSGSPAIARRLEIDRSLRPLRGRRPSRHRLELDVEATVAAICETRQCLAVLRAAQDRWLDIVLVVEQSPTMHVWQKTAEEWRDAIQRAAAPRTLTVAGLEWSPAGLSLKNRRNEPVSARSLIVPGQTSLVFYLTDAVGPGWMTADVPRQLDIWSKDAAVVLVQVLPTRLWELSSLRHGLPTPRRGRLRVRPWRDGVCGLHAVFVCCLTPDDIGKLAVRLTGGTGTDAAVLPANPACYVDSEFNRLASVKNFDPQQVSTTEVDEVYRDFIRFGSRDARRVAQHIACVPDGHALTLPLMRLIQRTLVPDAAPWQLAEMFLSGLLYRTRMPGAASGEPAYAFLGDIRGRLRDDAGVMRRVETRLLVSQYLQARAGKGATFDAVVATDVESAKGAAAGTEPFATLPEAAVGVPGASKFPSPVISTNKEVRLPVAKGVFSRSEQDLFLSMLSVEFRSYRELLTKDLERSQVVVSTHERWGTLGRTTLEKLDHHLSQCSAVIHLVGEGEGFFPPEAAIDALLARREDFLPKLAGAGLTRELLAKCSYTQFEAYLSVYHGRRLHIYRPDPKAPREPGFQSDDGQRESQRLHFERIRSLGRDCGVFLNQERLSSSVLADLRDILPALSFRIVVPPTRLRHTAERLVGREEELTLLDDAWYDPGKNVVVIRGKGGEGKTSLVATWMAELALKDWRGAERVLDWSFYSQGTRDQSGATAEVFINDALTRLGDPNPNQGGPEDRAGRLAGLIGSRRCLLVLDGLESLQYPPGPMHGALKDPGMAALLRGLATRNAGLCVVTTREKVDEIRHHYGKSAVDHALDVLSDEAGARVLHDAGARRAGKQPIPADDPELKQASREVRGHALTLALMGQFLRLTEEGDIRRRDRMKLAEADREYTNDATRPYGHAFKAIEAYETWFAAGGAETHRQLAVLRLLGLFDRPAPADCLAALRGGTAIAGLTDDWAGARDKDWRIALGRLQEINLIDVSDDGAVDCHPLVREYFAGRLMAKNPEAFRAAHSRLFDHLCATTPHRPDTLPGLQPLYQAVTHGCLAGRQQETLEKVYHDRILRGTGYDGFYSTRKLGAIGATLGAVAAFFEEPWRRPAPNLHATDQAWLFSEAALSLRALGRLIEAVEPMREGLERRVEEENWKSAAIVAGNLSELEATLGRLGEAVADGRRAIDFADRSGDAFQETTSRATTADALHQAGERAGIGALFAEAERRQAEWQPQRSQLYSLRGFQYAEWLLSPAERASWGRVLASWGGAGPAVSGARTPHPTALDACDEAEGRASQALEWATAYDVSLLDIALGHLTLARSSLYRALVAPPADRASADAPRPRVATALDRLRQSNQVHHLPKALLTAALYHGTLGADPEQARRLLAEAQEIAERGPMPLHLADVCLHRARLFRDRSALSEARVLIERHGYGRRRDELADAEAAAAHW